MRAVSQSQSLCSAESPDEQVSMLVHTDKCISMLTYSSGDSAKHKEGYMSTSVSTT